MAASNRHRQGRCSGRNVLVLKQAGFLEGAVQGLPVISHVAERAERTPQQQERGWCMLKMQTSKMMPPETKEENPLSLERRGKEASLCFLCFEARNSVCSFSLTAEESVAGWGWGGCLLSASQGSQSTGNIPHSEAYFTPSPIALQAPGRVTLSAGATEGLAPEPNPPE